MSQNKPPEHLLSSSSSSLSDQTSGVNSPLSSASSQPLSTQVVTIQKADLKIAATDATSAKQDIVAAIYRMLRFLFTPKDYNPAETYTPDKFITLLTGRVDDPQEVIDFLEKYKDHPVLQEFYQWGSFIERIAQDRGRIVTPDATQSQLTLAPTHLSVNVVFPFPLGTVTQSLNVSGEAVDKLEVNFTLQMTLADAVYCNMNQYLNTDSAAYQQIQQCKPNLFTVPLSILEQSAVTMADTSRTVQVEQCCADFFNALSTAGFGQIAEGVSDIKSASRAGGITQRQKLRQLFPALDDPITAYFDDPLAVFPLQTSPVKGKPAIAWETLLKWWQVHPVANKLAPLTLINLVVSSELISKTAKKRRTVLTLYYRRTFDLSSWPMELSFDVTALDRPKPLQAVVHTQQLNLMLQSETTPGLRLLIQLAERFWNNVGLALQTMFTEYGAIIKTNNILRCQGDQLISAMEYKNLGPQSAEQFKLSDDCAMFLKICHIDISKLTFKDQAVFYSAFHTSFVDTVASLIRIENIVQKRQKKLVASTASSVQLTEEKSRPKRNLQQENAEDEAIQQKVTGLAEKLRPILRRQVVDGVALTNLIPSLKALAGARKQRLKEVLQSPRQPTVKTTAAVPRSESMVSSSSSSSTNPSLNGHTAVALQITVSPPDKTSSTGGQELTSQPLASTTSTQSLSSVSSTPTSSAAVTETRKAPQYDQAQNVVKGRLINKLKLNAKEAMQSLPDANNPRKHLPPDWCRDLKKYQPNIEAELILNFWRDLGVKEETKEIVPSSDQSYPWLRTAIGNLVRAQSHDLASINPHLWQNVFSTGFLETLASRDVYPTLESYAPEISMGEQHWVIVSCGFSKYKMLNQARHEENRDKRHYVGPMAEERNCVAPIKLMAKMWVIENPPPHADGTPLTPQDFFELRSIEVSISPADVEALRLHGFFNNWFSDPYRAAFRESNLLALQQSFDIDHAQLLTLQKKMQEAKSAVSNATQSTIEKYLSKYLYDRTLQMELDKFEQYVDATGFMPAEKQRLLSLTCRSYRRAQQLCAVIAAARNPTMNALEAVRFVHTQGFPSVQTLTFRIDDLPQTQTELLSKETLKERESQTKTQDFAGFSRVLSDYVDPIRLVTDGIGMPTKESLKSALGAEVYDFLVTYEQGNPGYLNNNLIFQWSGVLKSLFITNSSVQLQANSKKSSIVKRGNTLEFITCYDQFKSLRHLMGSFASLYAPIMCHIVATFADNAEPQVDFFFSMSEVDAIYFQIANALNPSSQIKKQLEASGKQLLGFKPKGKSSSKGAELNIRRRKFTSAEEYSQTFVETYQGRPVADAKSSRSRRPSLSEMLLSQPVPTEVSSAMPSTENGYLKQVEAIAEGIHQGIKDIFDHSSTINKVTGHELMLWDDLFAWLPRQLGTIKVELVRKLILEEVVYGEEDSPGAIRHSVLLIDYKVVAVDNTTPSQSNMLTWPITVRFDVNGLAKPVLLDITLHSELLLLLFAPQIARSEQFFWQNVAGYLSSPYRQMDAVKEVNASQSEREAFVKRVGAHTLSEQQQLIMYSAYTLSLAEALEQFNQSFPSTYSSLSSSTLRSLKAAVVQLTGRKEVSEAKGWVSAEVASLISQTDIIKVFREMLLRTLATAIASSDAPFLAQLHLLARRRERQLRELFGELFNAAVFSKLSIQRHISKQWDVTKFFTAHALFNQNAATDIQLMGDVTRYVPGEIIFINGEAFKSDSLEWPVLKEKLRAALLAVQIPLQLAEDVIARMHQQNGGYIAFFNSVFALALQENNKACKLNTTKFTIQYDAQIDAAVTLLVEAQAKDLSVIDPDGFSRLVVSTPDQAVLGLGGVIQLTLSSAGGIRREVVYARLFSYQPKATPVLEDFISPAPVSLPPSRSFLQRISQPTSLIEKEFTRGPLVEAWNSFEVVQPRQEEKQGTTKAVSDFAGTVWRNMGGATKVPSSEWLRLIGPTATVSYENGSLPRPDIIYNKMGGFLRSHLEDNFYSAREETVLPHLNKPQISYKYLEDQPSASSHKFQITYVYTDYGKPSGERVNLAKPLIVVAMLEVVKPGAIQKTQPPFKVTVQAIKISNKDAETLRLPAYLLEWFPSYIADECARIQKLFEADHAVLQQKYEELLKPSTLTPAQRKKQFGSAWREQILTRGLAYVGGMHHLGRLETFATAGQLSNLPLVQTNTYLSKVYEPYQKNLLLSVNILAALDDIDKPQESRSRLPIVVDDEEMEQAISSGSQNALVGSPLLLRLYFWQKIHWQTSVHYRQTAVWEEPAGFQAFLKELGKTPGWFSKSEHSRSEQLRLYKVFTLSLEEAVAQASLVGVSEPATANSSPTSQSSTKEAKEVGPFAEKELNSLRANFIDRVRGCILCSPTGRPAMAVAALLQRLAKMECEEFYNTFRSFLSGSMNAEARRRASMSMGYESPDDDAPGGPGTMPFEEPPPPLAQPNPPPLPKKPPPALPKQLFPTHTRSRSKSLGFFSESDPGKEAGHLRPASVGEAKYPQPLPVQPGGRDLSTDQDGSTGQDASTGQDERNLSTGEMLSQDPKLPSGEDSSRSVSPESMIRYDAEGEEGDLDLGPEDEASTSRPPPSGGRKG